MKYTEVNIYNTNNVNVMSLYLSNHINMLKYA